MRFWDVITYPFRYQPQRLVDYRPEPRSQSTSPLGMEATDMKLVDAVNRRNDALERVHHAPNATQTRRSATDIDPFPEDETYAARYHRAYNKKGSDA